MNPTMKEFFTVDRSGNLAESKIIRLGHGPETWTCIQNTITQSDMVEHMRLLFPEGMSNHGHGYLRAPIIVNDQAGKPLQLAPTMPVTETIFELVRRDRFKDLPSRFESMFAWETEAEAENFNRTYFSGKGRVFTIRSDRYFKADMRLLLMGGQCANALKYADMYWRGEQGPSPVWEILIPLPVTIGREIHPAAAKNPVS